MDFSEVVELLEVLVDGVARQVHVVSFPLQVRRHLLADDAAQETLHELLHETPAARGYEAGKVLDFHLEIMSEKKP